MARAPEKSTAKNARKPSDRVSGRAGGTTAVKQRRPGPALLEQRKLGPLTFWQIAALLILLVATVLRLYLLTENVFHHDEGVNGNFMTALVRTGYYRYDPANYHGPTLDYAARPSRSI